MISLKPSLPWRVWFAGLQFKSKRAQYYEYLADALTTSPSHRTLLDLFEKDARRQGLKRARGVLTHWWVAQYPQVGGDLSQTWRGSVPRHERLIVQMAQVSGHVALATCFKHLSIHLNVMQRAKRTFLSISVSGLVACLMAIIVLGVFPLFTLPHLLKAFSVVPIEYFGTATLALKDWVDLLQGFGWLGVVFLIACLLGVWYSFGQIHHPWRYRLDSLGIWRLYRDVQSIHFLSVIAMLLSAGVQRGVSLRDVLLQQYDDANPWLQGHLERMVYQMDIGVDPVEAMNTGLMGQEAWWLFVDLVEARGLNQGLQLTCETIRTKISTDIESSAWGWRWLLLSLSLITVMGVGYWQVLVIEELRQALLMHYSTF
jgi:type II secretory pathway component PulF